MQTFRYVVADVFTDTPLAGNQLAVFTDARALDDETMQALALEVGFSETVFVHAPEDGGNVKIRIFTPSFELPFAGHPTLGSAHAWLTSGNTPRDPDRLVQECGAGLVEVRRDGARLAFAAPPLLRGGPVENVGDLAAALAIEPEEIVDAQWADNGPGWVAVLLRSAADVLAVRPDYQRFGAFTGIGVVGPHPDGADAAFEVRAFVNEGGRFEEDPVTGSLNASIAQWLILAGIAPQQYVAAQGTALGRRGRVHLSQDGGEIWVGGNTVVGVTGQVAL